MSISLLKAQADIVIGTGTTGNDDITFPAPLQDFYEGSRAQYLYKASELNAAGMGPGNIAAIKFTVTDLFTFSGTIQQYTIKIGTTATNSLGSTTWEAGTTTVYGPFDYVPTLGVNTFTFTTPFFWNGTSNVVVEICNGLPANTTDGLTHWSDNVAVPWTTGLSFNGSHTYRADNAGNLCGTTTTTNTGTQTTRPNITFSWIPAVACNGAPNAGTASATPATVCLNQPVSLAATGVTLASGLTYQWQSSTDNGTTWGNINGATTLSTSTNQVFTSLYRLRVICTNTHDTAYSNSVQVVSPPVPGGIYTINKGAATTWPTGTNFNSFNAAYNAIKCGISRAVVFNVVPAATPYNEQLIINAPIPNSSSINTITFNGNGAIITFSSSNTNERAVVKLKNTKHFIFDSLVVNANAGTYGYGFHLMNDADSNEVRRCTINTSTTSTSQNFAGIVINGSDAGLTTTGTVLCDDNTFSNNIINGGYYGVVIASQFSGGASGGNKIVNNDIREFYSAGTR
ncbi:MAG: hypothetical protein EOO52_20300 [Gammaproteobacteria bacterium]|nr:MAG: hypothetical protein EOO52_20300 [Gammaproteobacteria bacterium]